MALEGTYHTIRRGPDDDPGVLAYVFDASPESVVSVLNAHTGAENGRSDWQWIRFANGDLALAVFPRGETYFDLEDDAQLPFKNEADVEPEPLKTYVVTVASDFIPPLSHAQIEVAATSREEAREKVDRGIVVSVREKEVEHSKGVA